MINVEHTVLMHAPIERTYAYIAFMFGSMCRRAFPGMDVTESGTDVYGIPNKYTLTVDGASRDFHLVERTPRTSFTLVCVELFESTTYHFAFTPEGTATRVTLYAVLTAHVPNAEEHEYHAKPLLERMIQSMLTRFAQSMEELNRTLERGGPDLSENMELLSAMFDLRLAMHRITVDSRTGRTEDDALYRPAERVVQASIHDYVKVMVNGVWLGPARMTFGPLDGDRNKSTAVVRTQEGVWYKVWFYDSHLEPAPE